MAQIKGTNVIAPVVPFDTADVHPSHEALYGKGGYRTVAATADRDAIPAARREAGMLVYVTADETIYTLGSDLTTWTALELGGEFVLEAATASVLGGVKIGAGVTITDGVISVSTDYAATNDARLTDAREWSASTVTQADAEAGTSTSRVAFTPQRVFQAIAAWWNTVTVGTSNIADASVTTAKLADGAVTNAKIASGTISGSRLSSSLSLQNVQINGTFTTPVTGLSLFGPAVPQSAFFTIDINGNVTLGQWQGTAVAVAYGGTGATTAAGARTNLGLGSAATASASDFAAANHTHAQLHDRSHAITSSSDHTATAWRVFYSGSGGSITELALGASGTVLTSGGASAAPTFSALPTGGTKTIIRFAAGDNQPPASNFATLDTRGTGVLVLEFDAATQESANFIGVIPEGATLTNGLTVRLWWMGDTATSGNVRWGVSFERVGTDNDADSFSSVTEATGAANGTSGIETVTSITATAIDSLVAGDRFRLRVARIAADATNDTMTGDAQLVAVEVQVA